MLSSSKNAILFYISDCYFGSDHFELQYSEIVVQICLLVAITHPICLFFTILKFYDNPIFLTSLLASLNTKSESPNILWLILLAIPQTLITLWGWVVVLVHLTFAIQFQANTAFVLDEMR